MASPDYGAPIEQRGWTFQERRISTRILYYGPRGLTFFCQLAQVSDRCRFRYSRTLIREEESKKVDLSAFGTKDWCEIVQYYSARRLTKPDADKLNALAAVAKNVIVSYNSSKHYVAGLFLRNEYSDGLDWYVEAGADRSNLYPRPQHYRGPTFSWVSTDSKVKFWSRERFLMPYDNYMRSWGVQPRHEFATMTSPWMKKLKAEATPVSPINPYGPVKDAKVAITGDTTTVKWVQHESGACEITSAEGHRFIALPDTTEQPSNEMSPLLALGILGDGSYPRCGIVLQSVDKGADTRWRRVGFFRCCHMDYHDNRSDRDAEVCISRFRSWKKRTVIII